MRTVLNAKAFSALDGIPSLGLPFVSNHRDESYLETPKQRATPYAPGGGPLTHGGAHGVARPAN